MTSHKGSQVSPHIAGSADIIVIGGGPAGLMAANTILRQSQTVLLFDSGSYRNERASHAHMMPGWDHTPPAVIREATRKNLSSYYDKIRFVDLAVERVRKTAVRGDIERGEEFREAHGNTADAPVTFEVTDCEGNSWRCRKLVLATGVQDIYPDIDGYDSCWGRGIYHCLFCKGLETAGSPSAGVLAIGPSATPFKALLSATQASQLVSPTGTITLYTNGDGALASALDTKIASFSSSSSSNPDFAAVAAAANPSAGKILRTDARKISKLAKDPTVSDSAVRLTFADGSDSVLEGMLAHHPATRVKSLDLLQTERGGLGVEIDGASGDVVGTPPMGETSVRGVFVAGDAGNVFKTSVMALSSGGMAGARASMQLTEDRLGMNG